MRILLIALTSVLLSGCTAMVLGNGSSSGNTTSSNSDADSAVVARVIESLQADTSHGVSNLSVRSYSGAVILSGTARSQAGREKAARLAAETLGVQTVTNQILVE